MRGPLTGRCARELAAKVRPSWSVVGETWRWRTAQLEDWKWNATAEEESRSLHQKWLQRAHGTTAGAPRRKRSETAESGHFHTGADRCSRHRRRLLILILKLFFKVKTSKVQKMLLRRTPTSSFSWLLRLLQSSGKCRASSSFSFSSSSSAKQLDGHGSNPSQRDQMSVSAHPVSRLRLIKLATRTGESDRERTLRERRMELQAWNHQYWLANNSEFNQVRI